jgi:hypothetical protein
MVGVRIDSAKLPWLRAAIVLTLTWALFRPATAQPAAGPLPAPQLELAPGANLYWHRAGTYWQCGCDDIVQTDSFGYAPRWYGKVEMQAFRRDNLDSYDFATVTEGFGGILNSGSLDDEFKGGVRALAGLSLSDWYRVEATYLGSYDWCKAAAVRNIRDNGQGETGNLFSPFTNFGRPAVVGLDYNHFVEVAFSSELDDAELNLRRRLCMPPGPFETSFLIGVRYTRLTEEFFYASDSRLPAPGGTINEVQVGTENDMTGVQIGLLGQWMVHRRSWIDCEIKGALYSNSASLSSWYRNEDAVGAVTTFAGVDSKTTGAGVLDLSVVLNHQFSRAFTLRVGYSSFWMGGVALGADNFAENNDLLLSGPVLLDNDGLIVFHGPQIGLVGAW